MFLALSSRGKNTAFCDIWNLVALCIIVSVILCQFCDSLCHFVTFYVILCIEQREHDRMMVDWLCAICAISCHLSSAKQCLARCFERPFRFSSPKQCVKRAPHFKCFAVVMTIIGENLFFCENLIWVKINLKTSCWLSSLPFHWFLGKFLKPTTLEFILYTKCTTSGSVEI